MILKLKICFFELDSHTGLMFKNRIDNWDKQMISTIKNWTEKQIYEYAELMIKPLKYQDSEIDKLIDYIKHRLND